MLVLGIVAAVVIATSVVLPTIALLPVATRADGAADAAALAAANTVVGRVAGIPCQRAETVAMSFGATVDACVLAGVVVTVRVHIQSGMFRVTGQATAGPPPTSRFVE